MRRLLMIAIVAVPLVARADDAKVEAKQHIDRASELHKDGKFQEALDELKTAYALDPQPQLLFAMGQLLVNLGQCAQAVTYYERFLTTKPAADLAAVANEAITACKTNPPIVDVPPKPDVPPPPPKPDPIVAPKPDPAPVKVVAHAEPMAWYGDYLADGLVAGGVVAGGVGIFLYTRALSDRDAADHATGYSAYMDLIDSAHTKRNLSIAFDVLGVAAIAAGAGHFLFAEHSTLAVTPASGGGTISWTGRF